MRCGLSIAHLNVRSLRCNLPWFRDLIYFYDYDIFAVTETWLNDTTNSSAVSIPGFEIIRADRPTPHGGVAIFYKNTLKTINSKTLSTARLISNSYQYTLLAHHCHIEILL